MLAALLAPLIAALGLAVQVGGTHVIRHARHERCLANIARMEIELGLWPSSDRPFGGLSTREALRAITSYRPAPRAVYRQLPVDDGMKKAVAAQRKESVRIAKSAMGRTYH